MKWFKHCSNASTSAKLNVLMDKHGVEGYGKYWLLVELLADKWDGSEPRFEVHFSTIKQRLRGYHDKITRRFLEDLNESQLMSLECKGNLYIIYFPKLLEIKDNTTKNLQAKSKKNASRIEKNRIEKNRGKVTSNQKVKPVIFHEQLIELFPEGEVREWLKKTGSKNIQQQIFETYNHPVLIDEINNAYAWQQENNKKRKAGTFLKGWLERSKNPSKIDPKKREAELLKKYSNLFKG